MNIYRTVHMRSFIVLPLIMFVICMFNVFITASTSGIEDPTAETDEIAVQTVNEEHMLTGLTDSMAGGGFVAVLIGMGAVFITVTDYKNGYIKNYAGQVSPKGIGPIAKIPAVILEIAVIYAAGLLAFIIFGNIMLDDFAVGSVSGLFKVLGLQLLLCTAYGTFIVFTANLFRTSAPSIVIILYMFLLSNSVVGLLNYLCAEHLKVPENFDIGVITIERYIMGAVSHAESKFIGYAITAAAAYLVLFSAASFFITKKRDI